MMTGVRFPESRGRQQGRLARHGIDAHSTPCLSWVVGPFTRGQCTVIMVREFTPREERHLVHPYCDPTPERQRA